jgi:hypothetical protein
VGLISIASPPYGSWMFAHGSRGNYPFPPFPRQPGKSVQRKNNSGASRARTDDLIVANSQPCPRCCDTEEVRVAPRGSVHAVRRIFSALHAFPSDTERTLSRRAGMAGLRHKQRHKHVLRGTRYRSAQEPPPGQDIFILARTIFRRFRTLPGSIRSLDCGYGVTLKTAPQPMGLQ